jgi:hypothetical protein
MNITKEMIDYVRGLGDGTIRPRFKYTGLCQNFKDKVGASLYDLVDFTKYPNFSGSISYPIKSFNKRCTHEGYYESDVSKWTGKYGKERKQFCLWVADELERSYGQE